ncbi:hypothetical protein LOTGIDRAFT_227914 [Lottia gigantea]|uniref:Uncharacterized protein n=1 Tax=Lottia gigantea TaxID=225164 RepID=V4AM39_LOTGI|nr:hypothetical protein LOTGIDRAFT_227914 [Lottia gigantea]ESP05254.1 hypothetical protein LOTGIDRAFT_227914 [Lottia gigantea]
MNSDSWSDSDGECYLSKKRKMNDRESCFTAATVSNNNETIFGRNFVPVKNSSYVYHTENWKTSGTALFTQLTEDLLINVNKLDQISCVEGNYFIADSTGNYSETVLGKVLHLWRYDTDQRQLYISRSLLFTNFQEYLVVQHHLQRI